MLDFLLYALIMWAEQLVWGGVIYTATRYFLRKHQPVKAIAGKITTTGTVLLLLPIPLLIWVMVLEHRELLVLGQLGSWLVVVWPSLWVLKRFRQMASPLFAPL